MKKVTLSILFFFLGLLAFAQDYSLSGSYYCPKTKEALLIKFNKDKGYIEKIMYGKGSGKFANMQIMSQKGDVKALQYEIKFYNPASPNIVHHAVLGISPGGMGFSTTTNKKPESMRDFGEIQNGDYEIETANMGVPFFVRNIYWRGFKNETNNATLIAEDSQEGTA
ncbi:MAG: hypothetical protein SFU27_12165, partial [Thermonemataceae bacterium]|nr:hypothetical protein [Thermonemataceae bacterium]